MRKYQVTIFLPKGTQVTFTNVKGYNKAHVAKDFALMYSAVTELLVEEA